VGHEAKNNIVTISDIPPLEMNPDYFKNELTKLPAWEFHLLAGSPDPESSNHLNVGRIWDVVAGVKSAFDYVLVDLGRSLSKISLPLIQHADLITLVVSTDMSSVNLTKILLEYLKNKGVQENSIYTILNRAIGLEGVSKADAEKLLGISIKSSVPYLGSNFALANNLHQPYSLKFPQETAAFVFAEAAKEITAQARKLRAE
jgi:pilus assembly protein CpaE